MQDARVHCPAEKQDCYKRRDNNIQHLRCSGVHLLDVSVRSRLVLFVLVTHLCCRCEQFETSGSTLTQMCRSWSLMSLFSTRCHRECSRHCSRQSVFRSTPSNTQCASFADICMRTILLTLVHARTCGHKGGLLQLSSLRYFRTTVTTSAVCLHQRRRLCSRRGSQST